MHILILLMFIGVIFILSALLLFFFIVKNKDIQLADQISLLPLEDDQNAK